MLITICQVMFRILRVPMCCCCYSLERSSPTVIILRQAWEYYNSILGLLAFASITPAKPVSAKTVAYKPGASFLPHPATHRQQLNEPASVTLDPGVGPVLCQQTYVFIYTDHVRH